MTQNLYLDILGIPPPSETSLEIFSNLTFDTIDQVNKRLKVTHHRVPDEPSLIIYLSLSFYSPDEWKSKFTYLRRVAFRFFTTPTILWATIATGLYTPTIGEAYKKLDPSFDLEKYLTKPIPPPAPRKIGPEATPKKKPSPPRPQDETIFQFITRRAPSINYLQGFIFISRHTKNHLSRRGRKVYPYGQDYVARELEIGIATVVRIFSWLRRHHIIFKRTNENYKEKKSATWFVCTSWKQSIYFLDPEGRRPKKGSPRSRRK